MKTLFKLKKEKERFKRPKYTDDLIPINEHIIQRELLLNGLRESEALNEQALDDAEALLEAIKKARQARFEYGETSIVRKPQSTDEIPCKEVKKREKS